MRLITRISIDHFRSIQNDTIPSLGQFTALAGLNNSGKSNVLRALNAFFTGQTDVGVAVDYGADYYRHDLKSKKRAKNIGVSVTFELPKSFKFRKGLEAVEALLGRSFSLRKSWDRDSAAARYFLNGSTDELPLEDRAKVDQFLALISFRYIPNRVMPLDIVRAEHRALRDVLVRRIARKAKGQAAVFDSIRDTSASLIESLQTSMKQACPGIGGIRLDTPTSWQDLIFAFGYKLSIGGSEIEDHAQGSGIQSLLMLETLSLIDRDYFQKFGWRQAAVWAIEEPESSLHTSLEAQVSSYLAELASDPRSRLQVMATTHSDLMLQNADRTLFVNMDGGRSEFEITDKKGVLAKAAALGISRYSHPILSEPLRPLILVEGKYDYEFLRQAIRLLKPTTRVRVSYLEQLEGEYASGGDSALLNYLKPNRSAIRVRIKEAPIIVLPDWDASKRAKSYEAICEDRSIYRVMTWPKGSFNPTLDACFKGIERHMADRIIEEADRAVGVLGTTSKGRWTIHPEQYNKKLKPAIASVVSKGIVEDDLVHCRKFLEELIAQAETVTEDES